MTLLMAIFKKVCTETILPRDVDLFVDSNFAQQNEN